MKSISLALLFLVFQYTLWVKEPNLWKTLLLHQHVALQQTHNQKLLNKNLQLKHEIHALQKNPLQHSSLTEDYIRWKLGLVKEGEWFCQWPK